MSDALDLIKAVLGDEVTDEQALSVLEAALLREVDPLLFIATQHGTSPNVIMERAARWAGLSFFDRVPRGLRGRLEPTRLEALADVRLFRLQLVDREVAVAAPDFLGIIGLRNALRSKPHLRQLLFLVPEHALREHLVALASPFLVDGARQSLTRRWPFATAQLELTVLARWGFALAVVLLTVLTCAAPFFAQEVLLPVVLVILLGPACIRLAAVLEPLRPQPRLQRPADEELPVYSVLIPLRNESEMVPQLFAAMRALDYPADRLDIKFVVESRSDETIAAVRTHLGAPQFSLVSVPDAKPHTKPKALDFALPLCRGDYLVVFDAEDIPDPDQLWKAAARFRDEAHVVCLQAQLTIDNGSENWLTRQFAGEYAGLFAVLLPALARWRMPMPLGGTSNHFRLSTLRDIGGWDAFNVTEDADLGIRLARRRLRVDMLQSATRETAPTRLPAWLGQRRRWMKGWMQTFIVHNRDPVSLLGEMGLGPFLVFEMLVLGMIVAPVLHCVFAMTLLVRVGLGAAVVDGSLWTVFYLAMLGMGYGSAWATTMLGLKRLGRLKLWRAQLWLPAYWFLLGVATFRGLCELVADPFYWFKSPHRPLSAMQSDQHAGRLLADRLVT